MTAEITIYGSQAILKGDYDSEVVRKATSFPVQGAEYSKAFKLGKWDGRKSLFRPRTGSFPTGLCEALKGALTASGVTCRVHDHRLPPTPTEAGFTLKGISYAYPYDYQLETCEKMVKAKQGIVKSATGSGKTEMAIAVTQYLGLKTLFMVPSRELMYQTQKRYMDRMGLTEAEVGVVGDGKWFPGSRITVASIDTLESRISTPECMHLLKDAEVMFLDECVDENSIISTQKGYSLAKNVHVGEYLLTHTGYKPVSRVSTHTKLGVKITNEYGGYFTCSMEHPVAVWREDAIDYIYAKDLKEDDLLIESCKKVESRDLPVKDLKRYIHGVFAGDGHWHTPNKVRWMFRKDEEWWESVFIKAVLEAYPSAEVTLSPNARGDTSLVVADAGLIKDLSSLGFYCRQHKSNNLSIPPDGMNSYIGGIFDAEGYSTSDGAIAFQTTCETSQRVFLRYLRDMGLDAKFVVCPKSDSKHNTGYRIYLGNEYVSRFFELTSPLMSRKRPKILLNKKSYKSKGEDKASRLLLKRLYASGLSKPVLAELSGVTLCSKKIAYEDIRQLALCIVSNPAMFSRRIKRHSAASILGINRHTIYNKNQKINEERLEKLSRHLVSLVSPLLALNTNKVNNRPRSIKAIEVVNSINTVDFEVEEDHTFVADGMLTHNCHGVGSDTYYTVASVCPAYYRFGLSATPLDRTDGANLMLIAATGEQIANIDLKFLVERGVLPAADIIFDKITGPILKKRIQYNTAYKQGVSENEQLLEKVVKWTEVFFNQGLNTLILCEEIQQGRTIDDALWTMPAMLIPHQFIYGEESTQLRKGAIASFTNRNLPVLVASTILDQGVDIESIDALILAGSRKSKIRTLQRLGRGLRGDKLIVVDFANFCHNYLLEHSYIRLEDFKNEECFPIHYSAPDEDLVRRLWNNQS